ncbi:MAG: carboxypeptidase-like regulatory domain-containing protein, partial [Planctomycetota bacterium]
GERPSHGSARTDAEGRFLVKSLEDASYRLTLEAPGSSVAVLELGGLRPAREERVLRVPASRRPSARVRGRVVDASGATPANLALELATANLGLPSEVEAEGNFEVGPLVPGLYTLRVRAQGHVEHVFGPHRFAPEETWDLGVLTLEPAGSLVVRAQRPTEAATLEPWFRVLRRSADGLFELGKVEAVGDVWRREALAPGEYALEVGGHLVAAALVPFELHSGETCTLEIPLVLGLAREIHVRAAPDLGLARVRLRLWTSAGELVAEDELFPRSPGDYHSFGTFAPGTYRVVAELTDGPRIEAELRVTPDETTPLELELR